MKLVFIHGWAFDRQFWNPLAALLPEFEKAFVDLGFFGQPEPIPTDDTPALLIGHSLGFIIGMQTTKSWQGWIAINSFPRFVIKDSIGCVSESSLRIMKKNLMKNTSSTLNDFYSMIGAAPLQTGLTADTEKLASGLDTLRDTDVVEKLEALSIPGLVLGSENDPLVPIETTESFHFPKTATVLHPNGGHVLPQSDPAWCADSIKKFINRNFGGTR